MNFGNYLGLAEIEQEPTTQDGVTAVIIAVLRFLCWNAADRTRRKDSFATMATIVALDGVQYFSQSRMLESAFNAGVTWTITPPMGSQLVLGQSSAFLTGIGPVAVGALVLSASTGLHVSLGQPTKSSVGSISGQVRGSGVGGFAVDGGEDGARLRRSGAFWQARRRRPSSRC